jgi:DNA-binding cell septation regulator SpoVG
MLLDGTYSKIDYPANDETRNMIQRVIVAVYKKVVAGSDPVSNENQKANTK